MVFEFQIDWMKFFTKNKNNNNIFETYMEISIFINYFILSKSPKKPEEAQPA